MKTISLSELGAGGTPTQGTKHCVTQKGHWYKTTAKILMLFIALFAMNIGQAWAQTDITTSTFYQFYAASNKSASDLITAASLPSYITTTISSNQNGNLGTACAITTPHNFSALTTGGPKYYRLKTGSNKITIENVSNLKRVRFYGNGSGSTNRIIKTAVTKKSGSGSGYTVPNCTIPENANSKILEHMTIDFTGQTGYDASTYYTYVFTFTGDVSLWGIYVEAGAGGGTTTYTVTYNANGATGGTVPTDATAYSSGATVTVKGNTGSLVKTGYTFGGWNTNATGTGTNYTAGTGTFSITANTTLYAKWDEDAIDCSSPGTIFSAETSATANVSIAASTTRALTASEATVDGGTMTVINQQTSAKNLIAKSGSTWWFCQTNNNTFFKADLDCALAAGDVITIDAVGDGARGVWVSTATSRPGSAPACSGTTESTGQAVNYTVTSSDEYVGKSTLYFYRATSKTTYFNNINITRPGPCTPITPSLSYASKSDRSHVVL